MKINTYKGFGYFSTSFALWKKMICRIFFYLLILQMIIICFSIYQNFALPLPDIMKNLLHNTLGKSFIIYLGIVPLIYLFSLITENSETIKTVRGAELISLTAYFFELEKANIKTDVCIGKTITKSFFKKKLKPVYLPELAGHILLIGSTGTGKTNSILQMLEWYETGVSSSRGKKKLSKHVIIIFIYPRQPQIKQIIKTFNAPPHSYPLKSLLNQPFTSTFYYSTSYW
jgi:hypothetical protein